MAGHFVFDLLRLKLEKEKNYQESFLKLTQGMK